MKNCKCEIVKFDPNGLFKTVSDHIGNLKSYSWKPILIQVYLKYEITVGLLCILIEENLKRKH